MAKSIAILIPIFTILLASHIASSSRLYQTTTATTVFQTATTGENPSQCRQQQQQQQLNACQRYLRDGSRMQPRTAGAEDEAGWREEFPRCCEELEKVEEGCRCETVSKVVEREMQKGGLQGQEMREMMKTAMSLPSLCRIGTQQCEVGPRAAPWF